MTSYLKSYCIFSSFPYAFWFRKPKYMIMFVFFYNKLAVVQIWVHMSSLWFNLGMIRLTVHRFCILLHYSLNLQTSMGYSSQYKTSLSRYCCGPALYSNTVCFSLPVSVCPVKCAITHLFSGTASFRLTQRIILMLGVLFFNFSCCNHSWICVFMY